MRYYILLLTFFSLLIGCKKEELPLFEGEPGIIFYTQPNTPDSIVYTFATSGIGTGVEKQQDTIWLPMRLTGVPAKHDRAIKVQAVEGTTAVINEDFKLPEISLPADSITVRYPLVIYSKPKMKTASYKIVLQIVPSEALSVGTTGRAVDNTLAFDTYKIWVSNKLDKPTWWSDAKWGVYSETKYRFMINTLGYVDFSPASIGAANFQNFPVVLRVELEKYEAIHGPLIDPATGLRVSF
jgi:hypothetical protein